VTIDLTAVGNAVEGDEVVLCGRQGEGFIGADELGNWAGTNSYEILTGLAARMPRRYFRAGEQVGNCNLLGCAPGDDYVAGERG
jgi:alanine racemase